jgi:hypothetical protein
VNKMDQARLDYLLSSWEARRLLAPPVLAEMRRIIGRRIVTAPPPLQQLPPPRSQHHPDFDMDRNLRDRDRSRDRDRDRQGGDRGGPMMPHQHQQFPGGYVDSNSFAGASRKRPFQPDGPGRFDPQRQPPPMHQQSPFNIAPGLSGPRSVRALIGEEAVVVDLAHAHELVRRLTAVTVSADKDSREARQASHATAARLTSLLEKVSGEKDALPPLPSFLSGKGVNGSD